MHPNVKKIFDFLQVKENMEGLRKAGQVVIFFISACLILCFLLLIVLLHLEIKTLLYAICLLIALMIVLVISGSFEVNIGDVFKIKKDTEEIKKGMAAMMQIIAKAEAKSTINQEFYSMVPTDVTDSDMATNKLTTGDIEKLIQESNENN